MNTRQKISLVLWSTLLFGAAPASATLIQTIRLDSPHGSIAGDTYTETLTGLVVNGVAFDFTLTVVGTANLTQNTNGLGVLGSDSDLVSDGQSLSFSLSVFNVIGGTVNFDGFTEIDYNYFTDTDSGVLSLDASEATAVDNFFTTNVGADLVDISLVLPTSFHAIASAGPLNSFRVDDVAAQFTGTPGVATPEAGSTGLLAIIAVGGLVVLARLQQRSAPTLAPVKACGRRACCTPHQPRH